MIERIRRIIQHLFAVLANSYWYFPFNGPIYRGGLKRICFPGLNCYSCPAAVSACPLGALQNTLATFRPNFQAGAGVQLGGYTLGSLGLVASFVGRMPCGWVCPFGLLQEWLFRIRVPKFGIWSPLRHTRYFFLALFVIILPLFAVDALGYGQTWFCKYICPAGTLEAGIPLLAMETGLRRLAGWLFVHKLFVLVLILVWSTFASRPFCRTVCPLGAIFGLFNRWSLVRLRWDPDLCVECGACRSICPTGVSFFDGRDDCNTGACIRCLKCYSVCPVCAISVEWGQERSVTHCEGSATGLEKRKKVIK